MIWLKRIQYRRQPPTYDAVIEPVELGDNEVGGGNLMTTARSVLMKGDKLYMAEQYKYWSDVGKHVDLM